MGLFDGVIAWLDQPDVIPCRFETLMGDHGTTARDALVRRMLAAVGIDGIDPTTLTGRVLNQETLTLSGQRSQIEGIWDEACETRFAANGGLAVEIRLRDVTA